MDDLIAFLRERLAEDERAAQQADREGNNGVSPDEPQKWYLSGGDSIWSDPHGVCLATGPYGSLGDGVGAHIVRQQPARALAEVDAKRRIIKLHAHDHECPEDGGDGTHPGLTGYFNGDCPTLRLLALPYAGHPDYQETWKP